MPSKKPNAFHPAVESLEKRDLMAVIFSPTVLYDRPNIGGVGEAALVGDFNGDGKADIGVSIPNGTKEARWVVRFNQGNGQYKEGPGYDLDFRNIGGVGETPLVGDFNGDGKADIGVYLPNGTKEARWVVRFNQGNGSFSTGPKYDIDHRNIGGVGETPLVGDFNADGKADIGVYIPNGVKEGRWVVRFNLGNGTFNTGPNYDMDFRDIGGVKETPLVADFNGDRRADIGVYIPNGSTNARWVTKATINVLPPPPPTVFVVNNTLKIVGDEAHNRVIVTQSAGRIHVTQETVLAVGFSLTPTRFDWSFSAATIRGMLFLGRGGNDYFENRTSLSSTARGGAGNDTLIGGEGEDHLNGEAGSDWLRGNGRNDVLIAIDGSVADRLDGGAGSDVLWVDQIISRDLVQNASAQDRLQAVASFANGADRTLDGDRLADPNAKVSSTSNGVTTWVTHNTKRFDNNPLFSSNGPNVNDPRQGALGDCWLVACLSALAKDAPLALRQNIVDFDDGTYGVRLGNRFFRVDDDFAVRSDGTPAFVKMGAEDSIWTLVVEKAFAHYRTGANSYESLQGGWAGEVNRAFGGAAQLREAKGYRNAVDMATDLHSHVARGEAVTIAFTNQPANAPIFSGHAYTVVSVERNAQGTPTRIILRNPWGFDGAGQDANPMDGLVTLTPAQMFQFGGRFTWGRVV